MYKILTKEFLINHLKNMECQKTTRCYGIIKSHIALHIEYEKFKKEAKNGNTILSTVGSKKDH